MSGGAWEYVMGIVTDVSGNPLSGRNASLNSGFIGAYGEGGSLASGYSWPEEKYYDKYSYATSYSDYSRGHFGDATSEVGPFMDINYVNNIPNQQISSWYADHADFVLHRYPWISRGGVYSIGTEAGIFAFGRDNGYIVEYISFRVVLMP